MELYISNSSGVPIYAQITEQIRTKILTGELKEGDALPSIRALAKELRISVITTKRAYEDLEQAGFVNTVPGKGSFVSQRNTQLIREENLREIEKHMAEIRRLAIQCGLSSQELGEMYKILEEDT